MHLKIDLTDPQQQTPNNPLKQQARLDNRHLHRRLLRLSPYKLQKPLLQHRPLEPETVSWGYFPPQHQRVILHQAKNHPG